METDLLTSTQAARLLGVTASSVKRWADEGAIPCVRTPGSHRRFRRRDVERLLRGRTAPAAHATEVEKWIRVLRSDSSPMEIQAALLQERDRNGSWVAVAEILSEVLASIGRGWEAGEISLVEEHLMSERLARGISRCSELQPSRPQAPRALLAVPPGEEHLLGLVLAELCLREKGLVTRWSGRRTPVMELLEYVRDSGTDVVVVSASPAFDPPEELRHYAERLGEACRSASVELIFGGTGPWPDSLQYGHRILSYRDLSDRAARIDAKRAS